VRGHIRKRSKDSWTVVVELPRDPETGKRRQKWVTVEGTKRDAERVLAQLLTEINRGMYSVAPAKMTVGEYMEQWLETLRVRLKDQTYRVWKQWIQRWTELLGGKLLSKLTPMDVQEAVNKLPAHLAENTKATMFTVLNLAMKQAVQWKLLAYNPTEGVKAPVRRQKQMTVWNEEQVHRFLEVARGSRYYPLFHLALATGMRLGELLGLTWEDVNLSEGVIHVSRSMVLAIKGEPVWQEPKTRNARRKIPLDPGTVEMLRIHRKRQLEERLKAGPDWHNYNLVFTTKNGKPLNHQNVWTRFKQLAAKAGVPTIRVHDLRHTHATILLRQGVHPKVVSERLGHGRVTITLEVYSHVLPDTQKEAANAVGRVLGTPWLATR